MKTAIAVILTDTHLSETNIPVVKSIFVQAREIAQGLGINEIEHAGDIFHSRKGQLQINLTAFKEILDDYHANGFKINQVIGNHDKTEYSIKESFIDPYQYHPALNMFKISGGRPLTKDIFLTYMSYFTDDVYIKYLQETIENGGSLSKNVLLTHIGISGAVMNSGVVIESKSITPSIFSHWDKVIVGHYHDKQLLAEGKIEYCGASLQHNFGEQTGKGITVLYDDLSTETIPLKYPQYLNYEINPKDITAKDIVELKEEKNITGDFLKIILTGSESEVKSFNKLELQNAGIKVEMKQDKIEKEEIESKLEAFDTKSLQEEFDFFCDKNKLDRETGMKYFIKILTAV